MGHTRVGRRLLEVANGHRAAALTCAVLISASLESFGTSLLHMPWGSRPRQIWTGVDFHTYLAAAVVGIRDGWVEIYDQPLVRAAQDHLAPAQYNQAFLSPPVDAWLVAPLASLPYPVALVIWTGFILVALALALGWSSDMRGPARIAAVAVAMTPWWVLVAVWVGQVVPLVAAAVVVGWRLVRSDREAAAGLVLSLIVLKPNTAILVPFALLIAGRWRTFLAFSLAALAAAGASYLIVGPDGIKDYVESLGHLPRSGAELTLDGTFGLAGAWAIMARGAVLVAMVVGAYLLRRRAGMVMALGALASLLVAPYLHNSDLCLFVAAGWMVWHESPRWRPALIAMLLAASPLLPQHFGPTLNGWTEIELAFFAGLFAAAVLSRRLRDSGSSQGDAVEPMAVRREAPA